RSIGEPRRRPVVTVPCESIDGATSLENASRIGSLYPARRMSEQGKQGARAYLLPPSSRRILDHRSIVLVDLMDPMRRLQLARALVLSGDTVKAESVYKELSALWREADAKIPVVDEALAEYAKLR